MCEVESIVNGRPLTKVSDDPHDLEALTPNHLLLLNPGSSFPPGRFSKEDNRSRRRWRQSNILPTCSGDVGFANTFHHYNRGRNGTKDVGMLRSEISCSAWTRKHHAVRGR